MDKNYHYYVTYTAARLAGFEAGDARTIARAAQYVDECTGETVQTTAEIAWDNLRDSFRCDPALKLKLTHIWPVYHFLPGDYRAIRRDVDPKLAGSASACQELQLICMPESAMTQAVVEGAKTAYGGQDQTEALMRVGITMHVLADTFAHQGFAGIVSPRVNETHKVRHAVQMPGNVLDMKLHRAAYAYSPTITENSFGYLGHGRSGTLPDAPGETLMYRSAWRRPGDPCTIRCNPLEFSCAFLQMEQAMGYILGNQAAFQNRLDRGAMMDRQGDQWPRVKRLLQAFVQAGSDNELKRVWLQYVGEELFPADYAPLEPAERRPFLRAAKDHYNLVLAQCGALRQYISALEQE